MLGLWVGPSGGEGANQWATMLAELCHHGLADALIVCCDGLKGLPESIQMTWPDSTVQLMSCIWFAHAALRLQEVLVDDHPEDARDLHRPPSLPTAEMLFAEFAERWRTQYPAMIGSWETSWNDFIPFLEFPPELRKIIYTTTAIESLNARCRRAVSHRGHFPTSKPRQKCPTPSPTKTDPSRADLVGHINGWKTVLNALTIHYGDRVNGAHYR